MAINKLKAMAIFAGVVDHRSFSRAAHALKLSVASASEAVTALEQDLGVRLLDRTTRALAPTPEGASYYTLCRKILAEIADAETALTSGARSLAGLVRIQLPDHMLRRFILPMLDEFQTAYPDVQLRFLHDDSFRTARGLADLTFTAARPFETSPPRGAISLGRSRSVLVASPAYLDRHGRPLHPSDLVRHRCLGFIDPESGRAWEWFLSNGSQDIDITPDFWMATNRGSLLADAVLHDLGIATEFACNVSEMVRRGEMEIVLPDWSRVQSVGWIIHDRSHPLSPQARVFLDFFVARLRTVASLRMD